ncbi:hypothetical protein EDB81DRAFT_862506 [Dactylonectria macrodidyma]|uniref:Uncharacterized protein n=1 Tax=Dactylonectria macrodidyma TaxID=307937 RepID=A0A9P9I9Z0_9HYPO|nr:hypothetical protein EDB81DRAFT_862506 [Dactylonectria macrodidyma]
MSTQQRLIASLPTSKQVLVKESFIDGRELATKILPGIRQTEDAYAFDEAPDTRKRRRGSEERQTVKRLKEGPCRDSLPTPWKAGSFVEGPLKIMWQERLVREEKYKVSFNTSLHFINGIKRRMSSEGWDLEYTTVTNSDDLIVKVCVKVPSEFGHSFPHILEDLKEILATEIGMDLQDNTDK